MACYWLRDRDGFCHLTNRCWAGKPCPRDWVAADRARTELLVEIIARRVAALPIKIITATNP